MGFLIGSLRTPNSGLQPSYCLASVAYIVGHKTACIYCLLCARHCAVQVTFYLHDEMFKVGIICASHWRSWNSVSLGSLPKASQMVMGKARIPYSLIAPKPAPAFIPGWCPWFPPLTASWVCTHGPLHHCGHPEAQWCHGNTLFVWVTLIS